MQLTIDAVIENIEKVTDFVNGELQRMGCSKKAMRQIDIAIDELFANICSYAYGEGVGTATIRVEEVPDHNSVAITLEDKGIPFDPLAQTDPDVTLGVEDRKIGGLGIFMVKRMMNDVLYKYQHGKNILTVVKSL